MMERGSICKCELEIITAEYYYALKELPDESLLQEIWSQDNGTTNTRIHQHIEFFSQLLQPSQEESSQGRKSGFIIFAAPATPLL